MNPDDFSYDIDHEGVPFPWEDCDHPAEATPPGVVSPGDDPWLFAIATQQAQRTQDDYVRQAVRDSEEAFEQEDESDRRAGAREKFPCKGSRRAKIVIPPGGFPPGRVEVAPASSDARLDMMAEAHHKALKVLNARLISIEEKPRSLLPLPSWKMGCVSAAAVPIVMFLAVWCLGFFAMILEALGMIQNG